MNEKSKMIKSLNDDNLYQLCKRYGEMTLKWRRKFAGLLPEVSKRKLYEKKGFLSIFEFAAKLAGMSKEQVKRVLSLDEKFTDKPVLKELLTSGKESVNKLARIASIATSENEEFLAKQVELLPQNALETLVRDMKTENQNGLLEPKIDPEFVRTHKTKALQLSEEVVSKLSELQSKGIDINNLLLEFLNKRTEGIAKAKEEISSKTTMTSRHIPVQIKKIIHLEHGTKCSIPNCTRPATNLHHTQRFSLSKNHDPHFIAQLCHEHHLIAHTIDLSFHKNRCRK